MDGSVWIAAVSGLIGAGIGGIASIKAAARAQRGQIQVMQIQMQTAANLRSRDKSEAAAEEAIRQLHIIKQHYWTHPRGDDQRLLSSWEERLRKQIAQMELITLRLRDAELRGRVEQIVEALAYHRELRDPSLDGYPGLTYELLRHGLDCLGTAVRHDPLPDEPQAVRDAAGIVAEYNARMEEEARLYEEGYH
ncbi:hypothetical protein ABT272_27020 [Streptomyces sp900105245]|uniref:Uncharacterized protein n=1 Tax=Streptomyces sp. 900105245 TaxID=3154379 RepID=A0ABV1UCB1_9ACTN